MVKKVQFDVPVPLRDRLGSLAKLSGLSFKDYALAIFHDAADSEKVVRVQFSVEDGAMAANFARRTETPNPDQDA